MASYAVARLCIMQYALRWRPVASNNNITDTRALGDLPMSSTAQAKPPYTPIKFMQPQARLYCIILLILLAVMTLDACML